MSKKFVCLLVASLTLSLNCSSREINNSQNFYVKANYFGALFNAIGPFDGNEDVYQDITEGIFSFNKTEKMEEGYNPKYVPGFAGSAAIGRSFGNTRVELEYLHSQTNLYDEEYSNKNKATYIELRRDKATSTGAKCDSPWRSGKVDLTINENCEVGAKFRAAFKMKNEGFNNLAGMVNVYHDFNKEGMQLVPYVGIGVGLSKIKFLGKTKYAPAYQAKLGVNYLLTEQTQAFAGLRYFGILDDEFEGVVPTIKIPAGEKYTPPQGGSEVDETTRVESTTATITNRFGIYGLEVGLAYRF
ncbi:P44/Msp2 family outer membrane protein [Wolbachia endosymbiont of Ctenocephalides felis wCfeT]|uniref:P44/Msp2 family outer membrane protein n=1 Tax=Wolbachia endosymbiont of Ctenocephalides felis wCfeT TaxID=2732593 RepID=UPI0014450088|nr:P44/Msp2 family outer membrane protein [Wolbachia endosymbiont of Ctenocephalides felis wCfeT]